MECLRHEAATANSRAACGARPSSSGVDQAGGERIAGADPIDDRCDAIGAGNVERVGRPEHAGPGVLGRRDRAALRERDRAEAGEPLGQLRGDRRVPGGSTRPSVTELPGAWMPNTLSASSSLPIRTSASATIAAITSPAAAPAPQLRPVVEVDRDGGAGGASGPDGRERRLGGGGRQGGRDARGVEPAAPLQERRPVVGVRAGPGDAGVGPVVDDAAGRWAAPGSR